MIEKFIDKSSIITTLLNSIHKSEKITVFGCEKDAKLTILKESGKSLFFVTNDIKEAVEIKEKLKTSGFRVEMLMDKLDFKLTPFQNDYNIKVIEVLSKILLQQLDAVIVNPMFLLYNLPSVDYIKSKILCLEVGQNLSVDELKVNLIKMGFSRADTPQENEFVIKGDMVDICTSTEGIRVYFDYDSIETIKTYNRETLSTTGQVKEYSIYPTAWFDIDINSINISEKEINEQLEVYSSKLNNMLWCMQFANNCTGKIFDYLDDFVVGIMDTKTTYDYIEEEVKNYNNQIKDEFIITEKFLLSLLKGVNLK